MNLIFSADDNWGIGFNNKLLFNIRGDMAYFKAMTTGKTVVMGRSTLESLPGAKPLAGRENIVLTTNEGYAVEGAKICHSYSELFDFLRDKPLQDVFIIGGESIYRAMLAYCSKAYITRFYAQAPADCFMPDFNKLLGWKLCSSSEMMQENGMSYQFLIYGQKSPAPFSGIYG